VIWQNGDVCREGKAGKVDIFADKREGETDRQTELH
jgi:hypothetical protein